MTILEQNKQILTSLAMISSSLSRQYTVSFWCVHLSYNNKLNNKYCQMWKVGYIDWRNINACEVIGAGKYSLAKIHACRLHGRHDRGTLALLVLLMSVPATVCEEYRAKVFPENPCRASNLLIIIVIYVSGTSGRACMHTPS